MNLYFVLNDNSEYVVFDWDTKMMVDKDSYISIWDGKSILQISSKTGLSLSQAIAALKDYNIGIKPIG